VRISAYQDCHGPVRPDSFLDFAAQARTLGTPLPPLLLDAIRCLPLRHRATAEQLHALREYNNTIRAETGKADHQRRLAAGADENKVIGEYTPGDEIKDTDDTFMPRFLYAFWRLCDQQIATVEHAEINHSAQLLADRAGVSPLVRVIRLRRTDQTSGAQSSRDWQHRWVVRMHKVRQWYPSLQQHKVLYRGPYIKGPADKPLLGGETVRALIR